jgi:hypothetical protein
MENQSKRWMQILNLVLFGLLLGIQCYYAIAWVINNRGIITVNLVRVIVELIVKIMLMFLVM